MITTERLKQLSMVRLEKCEKDLKVDIGILACMIEELLGNRRTAGLTSIREIHIQISQTIKITSGSVNLGPKYLDIFCIPFLFQVSFILWSKLMLQWLFLLMIVFLL